MIHDPSRKDFTIADVLAWARTKPADKGYDFCDAHNCAVAQFGRETGRESLIGVGYLFGIAPDLSCAVQDCYADTQDWTFGGLVTRLEALCPEPVTKSKWLAIDAYMAAEQVSA